MNTLRNWRGKTLAVAATFGISGAAMAEGEVQALYDAVTAGLTGVVAFVGAIGLVIIGIKLAEKGIAIAKRNIRGG